MLVVSFQWGITMIRRKNDMHIRKATPAYGKDDEIIITMGNGYGKEDTNILSFGGFHEEHENGKEDTNILSFGGFHEEQEIVPIDCSVLLKLQN
ncbi:hypothetical protein Godav_021451 [Gossypium davidsonii]|uniref:Uncharacterized protein n=1 Tax=Gossypium davidsonii TaxID=34287 RepID=A0A7J8R715_GOSDV|nr:hypothetical protein [Gossypium davidsonii]